MREKDVLEKMQILFEKRGKLDGEISKLKFDLLSDVFDILKEENIEVYIPPRKKSCLVINDELLLEFSDEKLIIIKELRSQIKLDSILYTKYESKKLLVADIIKFYRRVTAGTKKQNRF